MSNKDYQNGFIAGAVSGGVVEVIDTTEIDNLETLIDESGVLDSTEGSVSEKVEQLIEKSEGENTIYTHSQTKTSFTNFFQGWQGEKLPRLNFSAITTLSWVFANGLFKRVDFYIDAPNCTRCDAIFNGCKNLEYLKGINTSKFTSVEDMVRGTKIKTIEEPLDLSSVTTNTIQIGYGISYLENIRFVAGSIHKSFVMAHASLLSAESIQSIIDGLATVETAQTLTLNSAITLTDEQKATINAKGWTLAQ